MPGNRSASVLHRPVYLPDYSMLLGCKCGCRFEPSDNDDAYAQHEKDVNAVVLPIL